MLEANFYPRAVKAIQEDQHTPFDLVGFLPTFIDDDDPRPAVTQLDTHYGHGGGWRDMQGFTLNDGIEPTLSYAGDPPVHAVAWWKLRDERIILFDSAWVCVVQPDGSYRIARMD
jgi:hypothetical protein